MSVSSEMFCNQCEQTRKDGGCTSRGVCGKEPDVAALQDLLTYTLRGLSHYALEARRLGIVDAEVDRFAAGALFSTLTNVNFDADRLEELIREAVASRKKLHAAIAGAGGTVSFRDPAASFVPADDQTMLVEEGIEVRLPIDWEADADVAQPPGDHALRCARPGRVRIPCGDAGPGRPGRVRVRVRGAREAGRPQPGSERLGRARAEARRGQPARHGAARRGQHGRLRQPGAHRGAARPSPGQGHPRVRTRSQGPGRAARTDRGQGHRRLHARRDAARPTRTPN